ncbi:MAG: LamG domain-containing protein, partial [Muribaculaceae bacterium]|nr:LamG domain-containing protein [Muribaculaceae bacterium]
YIPEATLNNSVPLSLFGDAIERGTLEASVDELKIWSRELSLEELRREMYSVNTEDLDGLVAYYNFNGDKLQGDAETFSQRIPMSRTRAVVSHSKMLVPVSARAASYEIMNSEENLFESREGAIMRLRMKTAPGAVGVYAYDTADWISEDDNLDYKYYDVAATGYCIHPFENASLNDTVTVEFYPMGEPFNMEKRYRLYSCDPNASKSRWLSLGDLKADAASGTLTMTAPELSSITDRKLMIVSLKPAIELSIEGVDESGDFEVFDDSKTTYHVTARLLENMKEPDSAYELTSDSLVIQAVEPLYFTRGVAETDLTVDMTRLGKLNERVSTRLRGSDERMIPVPVDVINRIAPREIGNAIELVNGGVTVGNGTDFSRLNNSNEVTLMGWVRIDSAAVLTGTKPLIFFRSISPSVASGIHLEGGNLRCHWNEESWSWTQRTNLNITAADLGKWMHVAIVARPDGMDYYLNGMRAWVTRKMNKGRVYSGLMLGQNRDGDKWFSGAFDQVLAFNRSLKPEEVVKYMHRRALLNDSSLVAYITMDDYDAEGNMQESAGYMPMKKYGTVTDKHPSVVPFDSRHLC